MLYCLLLLYNLDMCFVNEIWCVCICFLYLSLPFSFSSVTTQQEAGSCSRFLPVRREFFLATVLTWRFRLWVSDSVKHLETIEIVKGAIQIK